MNFEGSDPSKFKEGDLYSDKQTGQARRASEMQTGKLGTYKIEDSPRRTGIDAKFVKSSEAPIISDLGGGSRPAYPGDYRDRLEAFHPEHLEKINQMQKYDINLVGNKNISDDAKKQLEVNKKAAMDELRKRKQGTN